MVMLMVMAATAEKALSLCVLSAHTYMVLKHGKITAGLTDYVSTELAPVGNSGQSLSLLVVARERLRESNRELSC